MQLYFWMFDLPKKKEILSWKNKTMTSEIEKTDGNIPL